VTFKPLDLQMSVPRVQEFSGIQQQAVQRPVTEQNMLATHAEKQTEAQRSQSAAVEQSSNAGIKPDQEGGQSGEHGQSGRGQKERQAKESVPEIPHPYKGLLFDKKL